jgi:hypothetical protein
MSLRKCGKGRSGAAFRYLRIVGLPVELGRPKSNEQKCSPYIATFGCQSDRRPRSDLHFTTEKDKLLTALYSCIGDPHVGCRVRCNSTLTVCSGKVYTVICRRSY